MTVHKGFWDFGNDQMAVPVDKQPEIGYTIRLTSEEVGMIVNAINAGAYPMLTPAERSLLDKFHKL